MDAKQFENCKNGMILAINQSINQSTGYSPVVFVCDKIEYFKKLGLLLFGI